MERIRITSKIEGTLDKILERYGDEDLRHVRNKHKRVHTAAMSA